MKILVANLGSTSFKYRLFDFADGGENELARGGYERVQDFGRVISECLDGLVNEGHLTSLDDLDAVGFKTVLGKDLSGCVEADDRVLDALDGMREVAPSHNPAYAAGIRQFREIVPQVTRVALFETAFYQWMPPAASHYAVPPSWREAGIRRNGFHGASHKFVAERSAKLLGREDVADKVRGLYQAGDRQLDGPPLRVLSCHLGGSSSITGIRNGIAIGSSFGFSPQSGLPHNNRVGDLDAMAIPFMCATSGIDVAEAKRQLSSEGGLLGLSGAGNDLREIKQAAAAGNAAAQLAIDVLIYEIRRYVGSFHFEMGGADAIVFTGGIGENNPDIRARVCSGLEAFGLRLDERRNNALTSEGCISTPDSTFSAWVIPANEELVIAREVKNFLLAQPARCNQLS